MPIPSRTSLTRSARPLTSINLLIGLLSEPKLTDARRQQRSMSLYELLSRIDWLITTLLKISRLDAQDGAVQAGAGQSGGAAQKSCVTLLIPMGCAGRSCSSVRTGLSGRSLVDERGHRQYCEELHGAHPQRGAGLRSRRPKTPCFPKL